MKKRKHIIDTTTDSRTYKMARKQFLMQQSGRCIFCNPHRGCNKNWNPSKNWKRYRTTQWK